MWGNCLDQELAAEKVAKWPTLVLYMLGPKKSPHINTQRKAQLSNTVMKSAQCAKNMMTFEIMETYFSKDSLYKP